MREPGYKRFRTPAGMHLIAGFRHQAPLSEGMGWISQSQEHKMSQRGGL